MTITRKISKILTAKPASEGAGVKLNRVFGYHQVPEFDPFLLMDDFRGDKPSDYIAGFPWHPHRGIETITYVLDGKVAHGDSLGNEGVIGPGDVQWMTAGSGIIHQEMPEGNNEGKMGGFQLWTNLPASQKMMDPRYRDIKSSMIPVVKLENGTVIRIISGRVEDVQGPVKDIVTEPEYLDITVPGGSEFVHETKHDHKVFAYIIEGKGYFGEKPGDKNEMPLIMNRQAVLYEKGDEIRVKTGDEPLRFLLISGKPLGEPVAWYGPIVMNTNEELEIAIEEYNSGTFLKHRK